jgi:hypothetical protein
MLKIGSSGEDVIRLQKSLSEAGFKTGVDGVFGVKTKAAVQAYQKQQGLSSDGVVGNDTGSKLFKSRNTDLWDGKAGATSTPVRTTPVNPEPSAPTTGTPLKVAHTDSRGRAGRYIDQPSAGNAFTANKDAAGNIKSVTYSAGMQVDTDGSATFPGDDRFHQSQTSLSVGGTYANSGKVPYVAVPPAVAKAAGLKLGDLVKVTREGKTQWAIFADSNDNDPTRKVGEASVAVHQALRGKLGSAGFKNIHSGVDSGVTYEIFPGSGKKMGTLANGWPTAASLNAIGARI